MTEPAAFLEVLSRVAPGTALRTALERIGQQGNGALVVIGYGPEIEGVTAGGFVLSGADFTAARLAELAKMDGAVILDEDGARILRANAHLLPDAAIETEETGSRFRTAERMARMTGRPVLAVSEERGQVTLFYRDHKHSLRDPAELLVRINQDLQTLERFRRQVSEAEDDLTRLEVNEQAALGDAMRVLQRTELVLRIGRSVGRLAVGLGEEGHMAAFQHAHLVDGVTELRELVVRDYLYEDREQAAGALQKLEEMRLADLSRADRVCRALGQRPADAEVRPMGFRMISKAPGLPDAVRENLVGHFRDVHKMLMASVEELGVVSGVGEARAGALRRYLDQIIRRCRHP